MIIFKYQIKTIGSQIIQMPKGAIILSCQQQNSFISMWAIVDENGELEDRHFEVIGTGNEITLKPREYISTVQMGLYVWHIFEINA
ncbi:MAG: hypothetical protein ABIP68_07180 [Ferruginibacter sp.]